MKKFLVILMVVAMASFLFVGCMPGVTPDVDEDDEDEDDEVLASATPVMIDVQDSAGASILTVTSTSTQYMNETEAGTSILVTGTAHSESLVTIYLDDVAIAVGETATTGLWTVAVAESSLGADGAGKVLHATVTEVGLAESAASNSVTFTLDTVDPGIDSVAATASSAVGAASLTILATTTGVGDAFLLANAVASDTQVPVQSITAGTWTVASVADSDVALNIAITTPASVTTYHSVSSYAVVPDLYIPGVTLTFGYILASQASCTVKITIDTAATTTVAARATITFSEDLSYSGMVAGTYTLAGTTGDPGVYKDSTYVGYWTTCTPGAVNATCAFSVYGITDLAGNVGGTLAAPLTKSCTVAAASATSLKP